MNVCAYCWVENNFFYEVSKKAKVAQKENTADERKNFRYIVIKFKSDSAF